MSILQAILLVLIVITAIVIIVAILLQPRSQGGVGAAFGMGMGDNLFGGKGGMDFLTKATAVLSLVFVVLIMAYNFAMAHPTAQNSPAMERETSEMPAPTAPIDGGE